MIKVISCIIELIKNLYKKMLQKHRFNSIIKKYKNKKRVSIYSKIELSKDQNSQIQNLYKENYGKSISTVNHRHFTAFTGNFDCAYIPEEIYFLLECKLNNHKSYSSVFSDKNVLPIIAKAVGIKMPKTVISRTYGVFRDCDNSIISATAAVDKIRNIGNVFIKPSVDSCSGRNCIMANFIDGVDINTGNDVESVFNSVGENFVAQECIQCHETVSALHASSVNTFRIITYIFGNNVYHCPVVMRIGQNNSRVDNAHAGGMFIAVEDDGVLGECAFTEFCDKYYEHPNTHVVFKDYKIFNFQNVIKAAKKLHMALCQIGIINWDFTIDKNGDPMLIEANIDGGSIWMSEMAHGHGAFGDNLEGMLKMLNKSQRKK